jgi:hypothetical protein
MADAPPRAPVKGQSRGKISAKANQARALRPTGRLLSQARRAALSARGKLANPVPTTAGLARQANPKLSGRDLARTVRDQRSRAGASGLPRSSSKGRGRPARDSGAAPDQYWKVGTSETAAGQTVTGTRVGRSPAVTGDEPSTCRTITGTEYLGAEIFQTFCHTEAPRGVPKVAVTSTGHGNRVTGNAVGRSPRVTGDEPGTCQSVTGTEYLDADQQDAFCGVRPEPHPLKVGRTTTAGGRPMSGVMVGRSERVTGNEPGAGIRPTGSQYLGAEPLPESNRVPPKVGLSHTLAGGTVTGTRVGHASRVTGDEPGSCRLVTGNEYLSAEQFQTFCGTRPEPGAPKVRFFRTAKDRVISGSQTGRSDKVTGDEPGTCQAVTGTPYEGREQASAWCAPEAARRIEDRNTRRAGILRAGAVLTGGQPGIGGSMTGAGRGACEPVTGTPYLGADQVAEACRGALPGEGDFPRPLAESAGRPFSDPSETLPWQGFSVTSPAVYARQERVAAAGVTGTRYEQGGRVTGPFDMGFGKVTGTEQFRIEGRGEPVSFLTPAPEPMLAAVEEVPARSRVTGEGQSAGRKVTGDDWERGDRVTGTEGTSAVRRNPTRPGPMSAMPAVERKRNEELPKPTSKVTGASGSTERGALVTYSGGARG